jgi:hypothetical protein
LVDFTDGLFESKNEKNSMLWNCIVNYGMVYLFEFKKKSWNMFLIYRQIK